jgi:hypothetical protein
MAPASMRLRAAGIAVEHGLMEAQARELNRGFLSRVERDRPWLRVKLAMSLDGRSALASGESQVDQRRGGARSTCSAGARVPARC